MEQIQIPALLPSHLATHPDTHQLPALASHLLPCPLRQFCNTSESKQGTCVAQEGAWDCTLRGILSLRFPHR